MNTDATSVYIKHEPYLKDLVGCPQKACVLEVGHCGISTLNGAPSCLEEVPILYENENLPFEEKLSYDALVMKDSIVYLEDGHYRIKRKGA